MGADDHISNHSHPDSPWPPSVKIWHWSHHTVHSHMHPKLPSWVLMICTSNCCYPDSAWSLAAILINLYWDRQSLLFQIENGVYIILIFNDWLVTQWKLCFRLDNQQHYTLLAQTYHVYLLLLFQGEISHSYIRWPIFYMTGVLFQAR